MCEKREIFWKLFPGAVAFDKDNGFWMVSSVPRFPANVSSGFIYHSNQAINGQTILCVTVPAKMKNKISKFSYVYKTSLWNLMKPLEAESNVLLLFDRSNFPTNRAVYIRCCKFQCCGEKWK